MKRITVDLPDELYEALRLTAFNERHSVSEEVRNRLAASLTEAPANAEEQQ